ncbi:hypothetical protein MtrunA17_Chr5g0438651 [Medicago truncatula]|uniref:Uncharacterized protein n=1 Tax=Medicago truncatula TaxID=3880 RepID=A0A396HVE4_MEDTR|nr:hypothetical protein MtrunA17_Chr5g0438651 [Medicago truncatula]
MESQICWQLSVRLVFASARCRAFVCCSGLFIRFFQLRADVWLGNSICAGWSQNGSGWYACLKHSSVVLLGVLGCGDSCRFS